MRKLFFIGDIHGKWKKFEDTIISLNIIDSDIWHVGDGGFGLLTTRKTEKEILDRLNTFLISRNITLYNTRGNHDNPYWFKSEPILLKFLESEDKKIKPWQKEDYIYTHNHISSTIYSNYIKNLSNIKFVKDYDIINLNGLNIISIGGAVSIDRKQHLTDGSYFKNEKTVFNNIIKKPNDIQIVVSHNCPSFIGPQDINNPIIIDNSKYDLNLIFDLKQERKLLTKIHDELIKKTNIKYWFFGHFHHFSEININDINYIGLNILQTLELTGY